MKSRFVLAIAGALLLAAAGAASAAQMQTEDQQSSGQAWMMRNANQSAQSSTDTSYGGAPDTSGASGGMRVHACPSRPQCDIFFGR
jgi:type II secretory pathway pseudopilin PulG